ncbi:NUDIX hydrolase [Starkeya koreensis]|uniref:NUDIX hydrolase n=1 Tax=Ancylobacter koreensis TaxID=266121 RepID=A0ABT0DIN6_9HYPH|nr:NUDIX hydrolase [Ancylobacter koreensis]MCK0207140.1 NUDIX hydrolase [Ancylobacter koreensis]
MSKKKAKAADSGRPGAQVAALPFRVAGGQLEILVLTSRQTRRAVVPKGWPMKNRKPWKAAQIEARQEAGLVGKISRKPIGKYRYWKRLRRTFQLIEVAVFPLAATRQLDDWPERNERAHLWLSAPDAALLVDEPELASLILGFAASDHWRK